MANDVQGTSSEEKNFTDFARTGPATLAGQYLRKFWQPIYRSQDVPAGRALPVRIMSEDFTLYRGKSGQPHLTEFRCPHRGTLRGDRNRLLIEWTTAGRSQKLQ